MTRRAFVAGMLAIGGAAIRRAAGATPTSEPVSTPCTFGFGTYGMKSLTTEQAIGAIADIGFDSVMFDCTADFDASPARMSPARRADARRLLKDRGLKRPVVVDDLHPVADDRKNLDAQEHLKAVADLCRDLSPDEPVVIETVLGGSGDWEKAKPLFLRRLESWTKVMTECGATLAIKPHIGNAMSRPEQAIEIFQALGAPPNLRMCYDYSHFVLGDVPMEQTIRTSLPWTASVVMKDAAFEGGKRVFKLPGETGLIDYPALLRQFYAGGYRGDFN